MLFQYKDILGKPNKGIHSYRIFNIAIVDVLLTILLALFISYIFKFNFWITLLIIFLIGIIIHRIFCVRTTVDKILFS
jgi:fatty acid desaturase